MGRIRKIRNVGDYSSWLGHVDTHPLVSVISYEAVSPVRHSLNNMMSMESFSMMRRILIWPTDVESMTIKREPSFVSLLGRLEVRKTMVNR